MSRSSQPLARGGGEGGEHQLWADTFHCQSQALLSGQLAPVSGHHDQGHAEELILVSPAPRHPPAQCCGDWPPRWHQHVGG